MNAWNDKLGTILSRTNDFADSPWLQYTIYDLDQKLIADAAQRLGLSVEWLSGKKHLMLLGSDRASCLFDHNMATGTSYAHRSVTGNKDLTKHILARAGLPVAEGVVVTSFGRALRYLKRAGGPMVLKPRRASGGHGVTLGVVNEDDLTRAWAEATRYTKRVIMERFITGDDLRVMVVGGRAVSAIQRVPARVQGDGRSDVAALIEAKNAARARNPHLRGRPIVIDDGLILTLRALGLDLRSVPAQGQTVPLRQIANLSAGGDSLSVHELVHPGLLRLAERAIAAFPGLEHGGVDLIVPDLAADPTGQAVVVCEVNTNNVICPHHFPLHGPPVDVAEAMVRWYLLDRPTLLQAGGDHLSCRVMARGRVQKVGFRKWLQRVAQQHGLMGWARNVGSDRVEAELTGPRTQVEAVIAAMHKGPAKAEVAEVAILQRRKRGFAIRATVAAPG